MARRARRASGTRRPRGPRPARRRAGAAAARPIRRGGRAAPRSRDPKSIPNASCSRSNQAPPMPRIARPPLRWSSVTASFAVSPGLRNVFAPTIRPSVARLVTCDQPASTDQPSRIGPSHGPTMLLRWSQVHRLAAPACSARTAASRMDGQSAVCGHRRNPILTGAGAAVSAATSVVLEVVVDAGDPHEEGDPRLAAEQRDLRLGRAPPGGSGGRAPRCRRALARPRSRPPRPRRRARPSGSRPRGR